MSSIFDRFTGKMVERNEEKVSARTNLPKRAAFSCTTEANYAYTLRIHTIHTQAKENFSKEMEKMLNTDKFDLSHFISELDVGLSSWRAKAANLTGSNEDLKQLQDTKAMLESIQQVVGNKALNGRVLDRRSKIKIAAKAGKVSGGGRERL